MKELTVALDFGKDYDIARSVGISETKGIRRT
jgi:hypothetical protein